YLSICTFSLPDALPIYLVPRLPRRHAVEAGRVRQVLGRRHLLEEAGLHRHAVHEPPDRPRLAVRIVTEDPRLAAVVDQQRREERSEEHTSELQSRFDLV